MFLRNTKGYTGLKIEILASDLLTQLNKSDQDKTDHMINKLNSELKFLINKFNLLTMEQIVNKMLDYPLTQEVKWEAILDNSDKYNKSLAQEASFIINNDENDATTKIVQENLKAYAVSIVKNMHKMNYRPEAIALSLNLNVNVVHQILESHQAKIGV